MGSVLATMVGALIGGLGFARALESAIPSVDSVYEDADDLGYFLYEDADNLPKCPDKIPDWMMP